MTFGRISKPFWDDRPVAVIGGGPSLHDFDFEQLRGAHVLVLKDYVLDIPWADAGFGMGVWPDRLTDAQSRIYWAVSEYQANVPPQAKNITILKQMPGLQLSDDPGVVYGGTCEFSAMQVCIHKRARQIVLFGFDYEGENWQRLAEHFSIYVPYLNQNGITVANACPQSSIRFFQKVSRHDGVTMVRHKVEA